MSFRNRIKYFLVHTLHYTNKGADELIRSGGLILNGTKIYDNCLIEMGDEIFCGGKILKPKTGFVYLKFYKPTGYVSSLNKHVEGNLSEFFSDYKNLAIAGRLDKASEGLLLLSNDGKWVETMCNPKFEKEKEYLVALDKNPSEDSVHTFRSGMTMGNYTTLPCHCAVEGDAVVRVVLKEGKNKQIRRMWRRLGYEVQNLKRIRVSRYTIGDLGVGEWISVGP